MDGLMGTIWAATRTRWVNTAERIMRLFVDKTDSCWIWTGNVDTKGYGRTGIKGRDYRAHRVIYEYFIGPIPAGLEIDHLCRNRLCVNPGHMEPVTQAENLKRGMSPAAINARKVSCIHGHPLAGDNLYIAPNGSRQCKICRYRRGLKKSA